MGAVGEILKATACVSTDDVDDLCGETFAVELAEAAAATEEDCPTAAAAIETPVPLPDGAEAAVSWKRAVHPSIQTCLARGDAMRLLPAADPFAGLSCGPLASSENLSLVVVPLRDPAPNRRLEAVHVNWRNKASLVGQRVRLDPSGRVVWSMVVNEPYEIVGTGSGVASTASLVHPDVGQRMRHRSREYGRPELSTEQIHFFKMCDAATRNGIIDEVRENLCDKQCELCEVASTGFDAGGTLRRCAVCLRVLHDECGHNFAKAWAKEIGWWPSMATHVKLPDMFRDAWLCAACRRVMRESL